MIYPHWPNIFFQSFVRSDLTKFKVKKDWSGISAAEDVSRASWDWSTERKTGVSTWQVDFHTLVYHNLWQLLSGWPWGGVTSWSLLTIDHRFAQAAWTAFRSGKGSRRAGRGGIYRDATGYARTGLYLLGVRWTIWLCSVNSAGVWVVSLSCLGSSSKLFPFPSFLK